MFLTRQGRRIYLRHSYRDGCGRVRYRRLGHFESAEQLAAQLKEPAWGSWRAEFGKQFPEVPVNWERLRAQATTLAEPAERRAKANQVAGADETGNGCLPGGNSVSQLAAKLVRIGTAMRNLIGLLEGEGAASVRELLAPELDRLRRLLPVGEVRTSEGHDESEAGLRDKVREGRSQLPFGRRRFDPGERQAQAYLHALDRLGDWLNQEGRLEESALVFEERVAACPTQPARLAYGAVLQKLGRFEEAIDQYEALPNREAVRHYQMTSLCWQAGRTEEALVHLLRAYTRDRQPAQALDRMVDGRPPGEGGGYWEKFGRLWDLGGRHFLLGICSQMIVRYRTAQMLERGVRVRELVSAHARKPLLQRGLARAYGGLPG